MPSTLIVIKWRDIPAQVLAREGRRTHKVVLHRRFQVAIDRAAVRAGLKSASDYIGEWRRDARPCSDDLEAEATSEAARLDREYTRERLAGLIDRGGLDERTTAAGTPAAEEGA